MCWRTHSKEPVWILAVPLQTHPSPQLPSRDLPSLLLWAGAPGSPWQLEPWTLVLQSACPSQHRLPHPPALALSCLTCGLQCLLLHLERSPLCLSTCSLVECSLWM